jgi:hypothetical protein
MHPLMPHHACPPGPIRAVSASVTATPEGGEAEFRLDGHIPGIILPPPAAPERMDNLWRTTCFEIFWQPIGGKAYREFNLSPSGRWAAYDFDAVRTGMRDAPVKSITIACSHDATTLVLKATIAAQLPTPARVGLSAIIAHLDGAMQFWALGFPPGRPDFHSEACRRLVITC